MPILILLVLIGFYIGPFLYRFFRYKNSDYAVATGNSYWDLISDAGMEGEYLIYKELRHLAARHGKFLFNLYVPKRDGTVTEIDLVLVIPEGIVVFESKNFSGWIFGNEAHQNWTQVLRADRGLSQKHRFYNPVRQNAGHVRHLRNIVGNEVPIHSVIVFSDRCTLKDVTIHSRDVTVCHLRHLAKFMKAIRTTSEAPALSPETIKKLFADLLRFSNVSLEIVNHHIRTVGQRKHGRLED